MKKTKNRKQKFKTKKKRRKRLKSLCIVLFGEVGALWEISPKRFISF